MEYNNKYYTSLKRDEYGKEIGGASGFLKRYCSNIIIL
jgi:hypothetical protein